MEEDQRAVRTQIYLTPDQRKRLGERAEREGKTMAEVIREAVDRHLERESFRAILDRTFGALPDLEVPPRSESDREL